MVPFLIFKNLVNLDVNKVIHYLSRNKSTKPDGKRKLGVPLRKVKEPQNLVADES